MTSVNKSVEWEDEQTAHKRREPFQGVPSFTFHTILLTESAPCIKCDKSCDISAMTTMIMMVQKEYAMELLMGPQIFAIDSGKI